MQQITAAPLPQYYTHAEWDDEEGQMLEFKHLII